MTNESKRDWGNFFDGTDSEYERREWVEYGFPIKEIKRDALGAYGVSEMKTESKTTNYISIKKANEIIREELEKAPRVYGAFTEDLKRAKFSGPLDWTERYHPQPSHTARLICIEEIKRD